MSKARKAFEEWWTLGNVQTPTGQLAIASPAAATAWGNFLAGWNAHENHADNGYYVKLESDSE